MTHAPPRPGKRLLSGKLADLNTQGSYTPVLSASGTNPDLGQNGVAEGFWHRSGHLATEWIRFQFGDPDAHPGSGSYRFAPFFSIDASALTASTSYGHILGSCFLVQRDAGTSHQPGVVGYFNSSGNGLLIFRIEGLNFVDDDSPWVWGNEDTLIVQIQYPVDPSSLPAGGGA